MEDKKQNPELDSDLTKVYLIVSKGESDQVKKLGAKWDGRAFRWYYLGKENESKFTKWIPTYLNVPFIEKDQVQRLGAKWDGVVRKWYYTNPEDAGKFSKWAETEGATDQNVKSINNMDTEELQHASDIMDQLKAGIKRTLESDAYKNFLNVMARIPSYSYNNTMLIYLQNPGASIVAAPYRMSNEFGHKIKESEIETPIYLIKPNKYTPSAKMLLSKIRATSGKPVHIKTYAIQYEQHSKSFIVYNQKTKKTERKSANELEFFMKSNKLLDEEWGNPRFLPYKAYDISQAEPIMVRNPDGEFVEHPKAQQTRWALKDHTVTDMKQPDVVLRLYEAAASISEFPITYQPAIKNEHGYFSLTEQKINITPTTTPSHALKTLIHEMCHSVLHNDTSAVNKQNRTDAEVQAESVAYVVCQHFGLDTSDYSFNYIAQYGQSIEQVENSFAIIQKTADEMIKDIEKKFNQLLDTDLTQEGKFVQNPIFEKLLEDKEFSVSSDQPDPEITEQPTDGLTDHISFADPDNARYEGMYNGKPYAIQSNTITYNGTIDNLDNHPDIKNFIVSNIDTYFQQNPKIDNNKKVDEPETQPAEVSFEAENRIYMQIPFTDKDAAKQLGAKWDVTKEQWYCLESQKESFAQWLYPDLEQIRTGGIIAGEIVHYGNSYETRVLYPNGSTEVMSETNIVDLESRINNFLSRFHTADYKPAFRLYEHQQFRSIAEKLSEQPIFPNFQDKNPDTDISYDNYEKSIPMLLESMEGSNKLYSFHEKKLYSRLAYYAQLRDVSYIRKMAVYDAVKGNTGLPSHYLLESEAKLSANMQKNKDAETEKHEDSPGTPQQEEAIPEQTQDKVTVAIESTKDYTDTSFHKEMTDIDIRNPDGTYGQMKDFYRIVTLSNKGYLEPYGDPSQTFDSREKAEDYLRKHSGTLAVIDYDSIVTLSLTTISLLEQSEKQTGISFQDIIDGYKEQLTEEEFRLCSLYAETSTNEQDVRYCLEKSSQRQYGNGHDGSASPLLRKTVARALTKYLQDTPDIPERKRERLTKEREALENQIQADEQAMPGKNIEITVYQIKDSVLHEYRAKPYEALLREGMEVDIKNYARVAEMELSTITDIRQIPPAIYEIGNSYQEGSGELELKRFEAPGMKQSARCCDVGDIIRVNVDNRLEMYYYTDAKGFRIIDNPSPSLSTDKECSRFLLDYKDNPILALMEHFSLTETEAKVISSLDHSVLPLPHSKAEMEAFRENACYYTAKILQNPISVVIGTTESGSLQTGNIFSYEQADIRFGCEEQALARMKKDNDYPVECEKTQISIIVQKEDGQIITYSDRYDIGNGGQQNLSEFLSQNIDAAIEFHSNCIATGSIGTQVLTSEEIAQYKQGIQNMEYLKNRLPLIPERDKTAQMKKAEKVVPFPEDHKMKQHVSALDTR